MSAGGAGDHRASVVALQRARCDLAAGAPARGAPARAFMDDLAFSWLWPDPPTRARALRRLLPVALGDAAGHGRADVLVAADPPRGG